MFPSQYGVEKLNLGAAGVVFCTTASVPLPWCTSKSMMATRRSECLCTHRAYAAPSATLLSRQKPCDPLPIGSPGAGTGPFGPAWCPGGRTAQNTFSADPATTRSTASTTAPAAHSAAVKESRHTSVSPSIVPRAPFGCADQSGMRSQAR